MCFKCIVVAVIVVVGDVFAGSKFGGYGTFLPTQARGPSVLANPLPPPHSVEPMSVLTEGSVEVMELSFSSMCSFHWKIVLAEVGTSRSG